MRVTLVNKYFPPHLGGIEYHLRDLATALAARPDMKVEVIVANEANRSVHDVVDGVLVLRLARLLAYASTPVAPQLPWALRRAALGGPLHFAAPGLASTDLFHLHFPYPWGEFSWLTGAAGAGVPTVLTYHSDIVRQERLLALYRPLLRRVLDRVDLVIASSPIMVEHSEFLRPIATKCRVVPFGIDVDSFAATPEVTARADELRSQHPRPVVLFVGRLIYYKGADVLVRAMAQVDADLVLVGRGPLEPELRSLAEQLGVAERLTFLPFLEPEELTAWYHAADVLCLPSVARSEAYGLVQLEAHAAGTPVVSTRLTTGVPFVNQDGVTGLTVPPGDSEALAEALGRLLADPGLRHRLGRQARSRAQREFGIDLMVKRTMEVYQEALENRGGKKQPAAGGGQG